MTYGEMTEAVFLERPNRFIALVRLPDGTVVRSHVKNTGRCRELLVPGARVWLEKATGAGRKTAYDLVTVEKQGNLINMDSQAANEIAAEWLATGSFVSKEAVLRREVTRGDSRFDFCIEDGQRRIWLEVKGVTLEEDGTAYFPDAPTQRGVKHLEGLISCVEEGCEAALLFVIQMKGPHRLLPNRRTHPAFAEALARAEAAGVRILAVDCLVTPRTVTADQPVPVDCSSI